MKKVSLNEVVERLWYRERESGVKTTLLGIGPMSENIVRATFEVAKEKDFPAIFIASRNQVDADELGGGYVRGWNQEKFKERVKELAEEVGFHGLSYICRDHGGPWQRDNERRKKLPEREAMKRAKISYLDDLTAGFDLLHIDPTVDPFVEGYVPLDTVIIRSIELISWVEEERRKRELPEISYEVGTEETKGGITAPQDVERFLQNLLEELRKRDLPTPAFIVGQTGTLIKMDKNVGKFNPEMARKLASIARKYGIGFKEHNADFLDEKILKMHPELGITGANTGPEFSTVESEALLRLGELEERAFRRGKIKEKSGFLGLIEKKSLACERWRKWLSEEEKKFTCEDIRKDREKMRKIILVSGRYVYDDPEVKEGREKLFLNLKNKGIVSNPSKAVNGEIEGSLRRWARDFNLGGISAKRS